MRLKFRMLHVVWLVRVPSIIHLQLYKLYKHNEACPFCKDSASSNIRLGNTPPPIMDMFHHTACTTAKWIILGARTVTVAAATCNSSGHCWFVLIKTAHSLWKEHKSPCGSNTPSYMHTVSSAHLHSLQTSIPVWFYLFVCGCEPWNERDWKKKKKKTILEIFFTRFRKQIFTH